jgi:hypothetical protein
MKIFRKRLAFVACAAFAASGMAVASDLVNFTTKFDTDWTQAGVGGLRGVGSGNLTVAGVSGTVTSAYLYWHGPTNSTNPAFGASVNFGGSGITGTNIGFSDDNFWNLANSQAYRADVTSLVSGNGVFAFASGDLNLNGASLFVFFNDGNSANNRDVVLFNGNDSNFANTFDADGWNSTLTGINYSSGTASIHMHVSDGQTFLDDDVKVNGTTVATGAVFEGNSTPAAAGGTPGLNGNLWDIATYNITSLLIPSSVNTLNIRTGTSADALGLIAVAVDLPAGAAPPVDPPGVPAPAPIVLVVAGLVALTSNWKRKTKA